MKIAYVSDFDMSGSGYFNLSTPLCDGLSELGHEIKVVGMGYRGQEHHHKFSIIPCHDFQEVNALISNLVNLWGFDVLIVALDITIQEQLIRAMPPNKPFKYVGIMPIESDPLCLPLAMVLMQMDKAFVISKFGTDEARKVGVNVEYLEIGIDSESWRPPTEEERNKLRHSMMFEDDAFIVLTVADNQERKNLSKGLQIFAEFAQDKPNAKYILVTREHNLIGWRLRDLGQEYGINDKLIIFERGLDFKKLWSIYAMSDVFFLPTKAEGFGMPLLEAMSMGIPCIGTNCTAVAELLGEGRGYLADYEFMHDDPLAPSRIYRDPFGNGRRYFINQEHAVRLLDEVYGFKDEIDRTKLRNYAVSRNWKIPVQHLDRILHEVTGK